MQQIMMLLRIKNQHTKDKSTELRKEIPDATTLIHINKYNTDKRN